MSTYATFTLDPDLNLYNYRILDLASPRFLVLHSFIETIGTYLQNGAQEPLIDILTDQRASFYWMLTT